MPVRPPLRAGALSSQSPVSCIARVAELRLPCLAATSSSRCCMIGILPMEWVCDAAGALVAVLPSALSEATGPQLQRHAPRSLAAAAPSKASEHCRGSSQAG